MVQVIVAGSRACLACVGGVGDHVDGPAGQRGRQLFDQVAGQHEPGVVDPFTHQGEPDR